MCRNHPQPRQERGRKNPLALLHLYHPFPGPCRSRPRPQWTESHSRPYYPPPRFASLVSPVSRPASPSCNQKQSRFRPPLCNACVRPSSPSCRSAGGPPAIPSIPPPRSAGAPHLVTCHFSLVTHCAMARRRLWKWARYSSFAWAESAEASTSRSTRPQQAENRSMSRYTSVSTTPKHAPNSTKSAEL